MEQPQQPEETQAPEESQQEPAEGQASEGQESPPEESSESQEEASEEAPAQEAEAEGEEPAEAAKPETAEEKHKRKGGYQRQIERLARQNEMLMEQNRAWAEQLQRTAPKAEAGKEKSAIDQTTDFLKQVFRQEMAQEREAERQRSVLAEVQRKEQAFRATHGDYDDALDRFSRSGMSRDHIQAVLTSGEPPAIMYELASNPAELARISALSPLEAAREVGRLEAKLASGATPPKPKPAVRPPAPPSKVGGSSTSTRSLEDLPLSEYKRAIRSGRR